MHASSCARAHCARYAPAIRMGNETRFVLNACVLSQGVRIDHGSVERQGSKLMKLVDQVKHLHRPTPSVFHLHPRNYTLNPPVLVSCAGVARRLLAASSGCRPVCPRRFPRQKYSKYVGNTRNTSKYVGSINTVDRSPGNLKHANGGELYHLRDRRRGPTAPLPRL